jgi:hypothetical protein
MQKMEIGKDSDERNKLEKAGQNADASTEDTLLNRKKAMASAEMVICRKLEKAGQKADASTEDALLNREKKPWHLPKWSSAENWKRQGKMPTLPQRTCC